MTTAALSTPKPRKGLSSGVCNEFAVFLTVKPGHAEQLKKELAKRFPTGGNQTPTMPPELLLKVANHHVKHYLFDNDTRYAMIVTFDQSYDRYFDDLLSLAGVANFNSFLQHVSETPEDLEKMSVSQIKDAFGSLQTQAYAYIEVIPDMTIQETAKAQKVMKAFQQVLDNPKAAKALEDPALKPLLDLAVD